MLVISSIDELSNSSDCSIDVLSTSADSFSFKQYLPSLSVVKYKYLQPIHLFELTVQATQFSLISSQLFFI